MKNKQRLVSRVLVGGAVAAGVVAAVMGGSAAPANTISAGFNAQAAAQRHAASYTSDKGGVYTVQEAGQDFWVKWICLPSARGGMVRSYKNRYPGALPPDWNTNNYVPYRINPGDPFDRHVATNGGTLTALPGRCGPSWP